MNSLDGYQSEAFKFALPVTKNITYMSLGVGNEAGEVLGKVKKMFRRDATMEASKQPIIEELGDVLWYCAGLATVLGVDLSEVAQQNIDKLRSRQERGVVQGDGDTR